MKISSRTTDTPVLELTFCPECGRPAEILDRFELPSTDGPVEHIKLRCVTGRWFVIVAH
jgi:hypothetical protein